MTIGWFKDLQLNLQLNLNLSLNSGKLNEVEANPNFQIRKFFEVEVEVGVAFETTSWNRFKTHPNFDLNLLAPTRCIMLFNFNLLN